MKPIKVQISKNVTFEHGSKLTVEKGYYGIVTLTDSYSDTNRYGKETVHIHGSIIFTDKREILAAIKLLKAFL